MKVYLSFFFIAIPLIAYSQYSSDGLDLDQEVSLWFDDQLGREKSQIVLGNYQAIQLSPGSHPFYKDKFWIEGTVKYRGEVFRKIKMRYNAFGDYLIISHPTNLTIADQPIKLNQNDISWFYLSDSKFKNYKSLTSNNGMYNVLYEGSEIEFVAKRIKLEYTERRSDPIGYKAADNYYLIIDNKLVSIKSKGNFGRIFPDLKKDIKKYAARYPSRISSKTENMYSALVSFCNDKLREE